MRQLRLLFRHTVIIKIFLRRKSATGCGSIRAGDPAAFSLIEFMIATMITLVAAGALFALLAHTQRAAFTQADMQEVMDDARIAMDLVARFVRHSANDPHHAGFEGITIISATEVRLRSDITGSAGTSDPDKGDPDGDTNDAYEDVRIRFNPADRTIDVIPEGGSAQAIASRISAFELRYLDAGGHETSIGSEVRRIRVTITGTGSLPAPVTGLCFSMQIACDVRVATRR
jgi:type II secretory pathway pseudopilin PulG